MTVQANRQPAIATSNSPRAMADAFHSYTPTIPTPRRRDSRRRNSLPSIGTQSPATRSYDPSSNEPLSAKDIHTAISQLTLAGTPSAAHMAALASPCYFHKRFGDAIDIERVLEEIQADDQLSHSRLMQTAVSVREVSRQLQRRSTKQAVKNVMIVTKARDNTLVELTKQLTEWLLVTPRYGKDVGVNVYVDSKLRKSKRFDAEGLVAQDSRFDAMLRYWTPGLCWTSPELFDLVITLGGDGTVLFTSWLFQQIVPPVLSFSLGSLGFLTNFQFNQFREQLSNVMGDGGMRVTMRMRFTCTVYRSGHTSRASSMSSSNLPGSRTSGGLGISSDTTKIEGETHEVLNEMVIDRGPSSYISSLDLYANDSLMTRISADGMILSTPTGSTAYSLSAGGSLVYPDMPAMLLTPICPHTLSFRPMVLNDSMELKVRIPANSRGTAFVSFDGKGRVELGRGDEIVVKASRFPFPTVLSQPMEWFDAISRTLRWNTRAAEQKEWMGSHAEMREEADCDEGADEGVAKEPDYDIDFADDEDGSVRDSGYSGASSVV